MIAAVQPGGCANECDDEIKKNMKETVNMVYQGELKNMVDRPLMQ